MHTNDNMIVPFAGHPAANIRATTVNYKYGLQPGTSPLVAELAATIHATLNNCPSHALAAAAKAALRGYLCDDKLLAIAHRAGEMRDYRRHLIICRPGFPIQHSRNRLATRTALSNSWSYHLGSHGRLRGQPVMRGFRYARHRTGDSAPQPTAKTATETGRSFDRATGN